MAKAKPQDPNSPPDAGRKPARAASASAGRQATRRGWFPSRESINQPGTFIIITAVAVVIVVGLVAFGYWDSYIKPAHEAAVTVGSHTYDLKYLARRVRQEATAQSAQSLNASQLSDLPSNTARDVLDEEVLLQRAATLGISVSDDEIDQKVAEMLTIPFTRNDDGSVQRTPAFTSAVANALKRSGLSVAEFRREAHGQALRDAVRKHFDAVTPKEGPGYRIRQIIVADEARAKEVKQALDNGADFSDLASSATNVDVLTRGRGGMRDFTPLGILPKEFDDTVANLQLGQISEPFKTSNRFAIVQPLERAESKEYTEQERSQLVSKAVEDWLQSQRDELHARSFMDNSSRSDYVIKESGLLDIARQRATGQRPASGGGVPIVPSGGSR